MATPPEGANVEREIEVEITKNMADKATPAVGQPRLY